MENYMRILKYIKSRFQNELKETHLECKVEYLYRKKNEEIFPRLRHSLTNNEKGASKVTNAIRLQSPISTTKIETKWSYAQKIKTNNQSLLSAENIRSNLTYHCILELEAAI